MNNTFIEFLIIDLIHNIYSNVLFHRMLGGLLSAHLLIVDPDQPFGDLRPWHDYEDELLLLANDLAIRLTPAFDNSSTEIPLPRVCSIIRI